MSNFESLTLHPIKKVFQLATWVDDYFGKHHYGIRFEGEETFYSENAINKALEFKMSAEKSSSPKNPLLIRFQITVSATVYPPITPEKITQRLIENATVQIKEYVADMITPIASENTAIRG